MKKLFLFISFLFVLHLVQGQNVLQLIPEPVCWTDQDSSLTRYWLISSNGSKKIWGYLNAAGDFVTPDVGAFFSKGHCNCCNGSSGGDGGPDADWAFVTGSSIVDPIYRNGTVSIFTTETTHGLRLDGTWQFRPAASSFFDWQPGTDTLGLDFVGLRWEAPATVSGTGNLNGGSNNVIVGSQSTMFDRTRLGVFGFAGNDPSGTGLALGAFIEAYAEGTWSPTNTGTSLQFWVTPTGSIARQNVVSFINSGRVEFDQYTGFNDGVPLSLLGYGKSATRQIDKHPISGTAVAGSVLGINDDSNGFEWLDVSGLSDGNGIYSGSGSTPASLVEVNNTAGIRIFNAADHSVLFAHQLVTINGVINIEYPIIFESTGSFPAFGGIGLKRGTLEILNNEAIEIRAGAGTIFLGSAGFTFTDNFHTFSSSASGGFFSDATGIYNGIQYSGFPDYTSLVSNSLVPKQYVDDAIAAAGNGIISELPLNPVYINANFNDFELDSLENMYLWARTKIRLGVIGDESNPYIDINPGGDGFLGLDFHTTGYMKGETISVAPETVFTYQGRSAQDDAIITNMQLDSTSVAFEASTESDGSINLAPDCAGQQNKIFRWDLDGGVDDITVDSIQNPYHSLGASVFVSPGVPYTRPEIVGMYTFHFYNASNTTLDLPANVLGMDGLELDGGATLVIPNKCIITGYYDGTNHWMTISY